MSRSSFQRQAVVDAERGSDHGDYSGMARRIIRAMGRRVATSDPDDLLLMLNLRDELDQAIQEAVTGQRRAGFSWASIARPLGMSKQAAAQRWGDGEAHAGQLLDALRAERFGGRHD